MTKILERIHGSVVSYLLSLIGGVSAKELKVARWIKQDEETRPYARVDSIRLDERNQLNHRSTTETQAIYNIGNFFDIQCNDRARS